MARLPLIPFIAAALIAAAACATTSDPMPEVPPGADALTVQTFPEEIARYFYSGISDRRRVVIRDQPAWATFWTELVAHHQPPPAAPAIDFSKEMVLVASMGSRTSGGYSIHVDAVHEADGKLYVTVREVSPGPDCVTTAAITSPVTAVRVSRRDGEALFVERKETRNCG